MSEHERSFPVSAEAPTEADYAQLHEQMVEGFAKQYRYFRNMRLHGISPADSLAHIRVWGVDFRGWKCSIPHEDPLDYDEYSLLVSDEYDKYAVAGVKLFPEPQHDTKAESLTPETTCLLDVYVLSVDSESKPILHRETSFQSIPDSEPYDDLVSGHKAQRLNEKQQDMFSDFVRYYEEQSNFDAAQGMVNVIEAYLADVTD